MRISDWSSDVCSSDLAGDPHEDMGVGLGEMLDRQLLGMLEIHRRVMPLGRSRDVMVLRRRATAKMPGNVDRDNAKFFVGERRKGQVKIGRAHVCTPVTNAHLVLCLLLEKKNKKH